MGNVRRMAVCRICASPRLRVRSRGARRFGWCKVCGAVTAILTFAEYEALNPTYDPGPGPSMHSDVELRERLGVEDKISFIARYLGDRRQARVIDVGCGAGGYLLAARELGFDAVGVEPSVAHSTVARALGLDVRTGYFDVRAFAPRSFDLVLTSHVVEHIFNPRDFMSDLATLVRPGGWLVAVTPNADYLAARWSGRFWVMLKPVDHVSLLTERAVAQLQLQRFGTLTFRRSSLHGEFLATLAAAMRDAALGIGTDASAGDGALSPIGGLGVQRTKALLSRLSGPVDRALDRAGRGACLVTEIRVPEASQVGGGASANGPGR